VKGPDHGSTLSETKINVKVTQLAAAGRPRRAPAVTAPRGQRRPARVAGETRGSVRSGRREVIETGQGHCRVPAAGEGRPWRAVFTGNGRPRYRQAPTEADLAEKLGKDRERLAADAANMERRGADLIAFYLSPDRHPASRQWSRGHAGTQGKLCEWIVPDGVIDVDCAPPSVRAAAAVGEQVVLEGGRLMRFRNWRAGRRPTPSW
jgi:hypothetical protein